MLSRGTAILNQYYRPLLTLSHIKLATVLEPELWGTGHFGTGNRGTGNRFPGTIRGEPGNRFPGTGSLVPVWFPLWFPGTVRGEPGNRFPGSPGTQVGTGTLVYKEKSRERATTAPHDKHKSVQSRGAFMH